MTTTTPKTHAVLKRPRPIPLLISLAQAIEAAVSKAATTFLTPTPSMTQLTADINALVTAETAAKSRVMGAVQTRNAKAAVVVADLKLLVAYVETVANADPANAEAIVVSAGMVVRKQPVRTKNAVNVKQGTASGSVTVTARVGSRTKQAHEWQFSTDGGKTWTAVPTTTVAKTTITGFTPGSTVLVRHQAVTNTGLSGWTDPASLLVI